MVTLTGFENAHKTAEDWRAYLARLDRRIAAQEAEIQALKAAGRKREAWNLMARDAIYEHRDRARYELSLLEAKKN